MKLDESLQPESVFKRVFSLYGTPGLVQERTEVLFVKLSLLLFALFLFRLMILDMMPTLLTAGVIFVFAVLLTLGTLYALAALNRKDGVSKLAFIFLSLLLFILFLRVGK